MAFFKKDIIKISIEDIYDESSNDFDKTRDFINLLIEVVKNQDKKYDYYTTCHGDSYYIDELKSLYTLHIKKNNYIDIVLSKDCEDNYYFTSLKFLISDLKYDNIHLCCLKKGTKNYLLCQELFDILEKRCSDNIDSIIEHLNSL